MKTKFKAIITILTVLIILLFSSSETYALGEYTFLEPLPGIAPTATLTEYIPKVFTLSIGIAAVLAFVMITFGGIMYMTSDAISGKAQGRKYIEDALWGLLLVIGAYAILYTINPQILQFNLSVEKINIASRAGVDVVGSVPFQPCPTCQTLSSLNLPATGSAVGKSVDPALATDLVRLNNALKNENLGWRITEAWPPSINHQNVCHQVGTCVDANLSTANATTINRFIQLSKASGLKAIYEVRTAGLKDSLVLAGVDKDSVAVVPTITGEHFSVYNN